jgi:hypothetical protein
MTPQPARQNKAAIVAQSLYLANLLLLPGLSFFYLLWYAKQHLNESSIAKIHLYRAVQLSIAAGVAIILLPLVVMIVSPEFEASLMVLILYFVTVHAGLVLIGMLNLARAMSGRLPVF